MLLDETSVDVFEELRPLKPLNVRLAEDGCLSESPNLKREAVPEAAADETKSVEVVLL